MRAKSDIICQNLLTVFISPSFILQFVVTGQKRKLLGKRHFVRAIAISQPVTPLPPAPTIPHGKQRWGYKVFPSASHLVDI